MTVLIHAPHLKPNGTISSAVAMGGIKCYAISDAVSVVACKQKHFGELFLRKL